jgi:hypothetical protein
MKKVEAGQSNSLYYILALIFGILTGYVVTSSIAWALLGALAGLIFALFYVNVLVEKREV